MSRRPNRAGTALEPFATVLRTVLGMLAALIGLAAVATVVGSGSVLGWGDDEVCVAARNEVVRTTSDVALAELRPGTRAYADTVQLCAPAPSTGQRLLGSLAEAQLGLVALGTLVLLLLVVRGAERHGPFSAPAVRAIRRVGWWLVLATPLAAVAEAVARTALLRTVVTYPVGGWDWVPDVRPPFALMIAGAGVLTVARILRIGVDMREEIEAVV